MLLVCLLSISRLRLYKQEIFQQNVVMRVAHLVRGIAKRKCGSSLIARCFREVFHKGDSLYADLMSIHTDEPKVSYQKLTLPDCSGRYITAQRAGEVGDLPSQRQILPILHPSRNEDRVQ